VIHRFAALLMLLSVIHSFGERVSGLARDAQVHHEAGVYAVSPDGGPAGEHHHPGDPTDEPEHQHGTSADHCTHHHGVLILSAPLALTDGARAPRAEFSEPGPGPERTGQPFPRPPRA